jgi:hypothetical protein
MFSSLCALIRISAKILSQSFSIPDTPCPVKHFFVAELRFKVLVFEEQCSALLSIVCNYTGREYPDTAVRKQKGAVKRF